MSQKYLQQVSWVCIYLSQEVKQASREKEEVMPDITVPVPEERTAEFYQFFGLWLAGSLNVSHSLGRAPAEASEPPATPQKVTSWGTTEQDYADAEALWKKYSANARKMFSLMIDDPDTKYTGEEIAEACGIPNGAHGVAGVLAWPGRHGAAIGRGLPTEWAEDEDAGTSYYWIPEERAAMFWTVREKVEASA